ncbi:MAG: ABC transporter substrate-binding protein [Peptostreptococcaceae bacterium]|nr:ABC transporter substrate-binding protein [Peptostreptococcaceae bacterium]
MKKRNAKDQVRWIAFLLVILMMTSVFAGCTPQQNAQQEEKKPETTEQQPEKAEEITLVDSVGRNVTIKYPAQTAVVVDRYNNEMIRACGAIDKVVAVDMNTAQDREYWKMFDPEKVIGDDLSDYNYEKIIELKPDVFIISDISPYEEAEQKLSTFEIPAFAIVSYVPSKFEENVKNVGKIFGVEEGAEKFFNYFNDKLNYINENVKDSDIKSVYFETTTELKTAFPGSGYNEIIEYAKGKNIFADDYKNFSSPEIDPEEVLKRDPDVIIKLVTDPSLKGAGVYTPPSKEYFQEIYRSMIARPGWEDLDAVKNGRVYFMTQFGQGGAGKLVGTMFAAKWMHPEQLPDLDPNEVFRAWMEDFQGFKNIEGHFYTAEDLK